MIFKPELSQPEANVESALSILYLGPNSGTSRHRALSISRLGHQVHILDPLAFLPKRRLSDFWIHHTGSLGLARYIRNRVLAAIKFSEFDLVWVDAGNLICPELICDLKQRARFVLNYNLDDPYGSRDGDKWRLYLRSVPVYDLIAVARDCNVPEAYALGAKDVMRVYMSADEVFHAPRPVSALDRDKWKSEVSFIGTWMPERGPFFEQLVARGIPLSLWGNQWHRAREWPVLRPYWRGPGLGREDDYAMAIQSAKVCIGMLSKGNRDFCTTRSFEVPHLGGLLCAERTCEHEALYRENEEAVFWSDPDECALKCRRLLAEDEWRRRVARNGQLRHLRNETTNENVMRQILSRMPARNHSGVAQRSIHDLAH